MPGTISQEMRDWLLETEKLGLKPYSSDGSKSGNCTIGYGHFLNSGACSGVYKEGITKEQAVEFFDRDLQTAVELVKKYIAVDLDQSQFDALVSAAFRLGEGSFKNSEAVAQIDQGNYAEGGDKILNWGGSRGKGQANRANAEWSRYFGGGFKAFVVPRKLEFRLEITSPNRPLPKIPN